MSDSIDPREVVAILFRHKRKVVACALLVMSAALVLTALMQPRFRSRAMLFVRLGRENVALDPTASIGSGSLMAVPSAREDEINSVVEILRSRALAERVVDKIGPEQILSRSIPESDPPEAAATADSTSTNTLWMYIERLALWTELSPREQTLQKFERLLNVSAPKHSTVVYVAYDGPSPQVAQRIVTELIDTYLEEHVRLNRTAGSHDFFIEQSNQMRAELTSVETELRDLKNRTGMTAVEDQRKILVDRAGRLEDDVLRSGAELASLEAELAALNEKLVSLPETRITQSVSGLPNQAADLMRQQLYSLQLKEQDLLSTFKDEARQVQEIRRQIQEAQAILAKEEMQRTQATNGSDPTFQKLQLGLHNKQAEAASLKARIEKSGMQLVAARSELEQLNDHEMHIVQLRRDVALKEANYRRYADNLEQARIDQALKLERISNISVAQPASLEPKQVRPQVLLQLAAGLLASVMLSIGLAFAAEYFDRSIKSSDDLEEQLELIPLATIPALAPSTLQIGSIQTKHAHVLPR